jgi:predicted amidohydrolase YtcJ
VQYPDIIVYNGTIVTMSDASLNNSPGRIAEAMAVRGDRIQFIGGNQEILQYAGPQTRKIDL